MAFTIEPHEGRWVVLQDGMPVFSGDYGQVEDWLDKAENNASGEQQAEDPTKAVWRRSQRRRRDPRIDNYEGSREVKGLSRRTGGRPAF